MAPPTRRASLADVDGAPVPGRRRERQGDVLAHGALRQQRLQRGSPGHTRVPLRSRPPDGRSAWPRRRPVALHRRDGAPRRAPRTARPGPAPRARRCPAPRRHAARTRRRAVGCRRAGSAPSTSAGAASRPTAASVLAVTTASGRPLGPSAAPSINWTIRSSAPGVMSTTPTVSPSRSTVARSQSAETSRSRCEMKMTDSTTLALSPDDIQDPLGEVRGERGGHLVEQQDVRSDRQRAREVEDAQRSQWQVPRVSRKGRDRRCPARRANGGSGRRRDSVSRRFEAMSRSGMSDGSWYTDTRPPPARLRRRVHAAFLAPDDDATGVRPNRTGQDLDQRALPGTVRAQERVDLARDDGQRRIAQRHDCAVALGDPGSLEQQVGHRSPERMQKAGTGRRTGTRADDRVEGQSLGTLAGDDLLLGVGGKRRQRVHQRPKVALLEMSASNAVANAVLPASVTLSQTTGVVRFLAWAGF